MLSGTEVAKGPPARAKSPNIRCATGIGGDLPLAQASIRLPTVSYTLLHDDVLSSGKVKMSCLDSESFARESFSAHRRGLRWLEGLSSAGFATNASGCTCKTCKGLAPPRTGVILMHEDDEVCRIALGNEDLSFEGLYTEFH